MRKVGEITVDHNGEDISLLYDGTLVEILRIDRDLALELAQAILDEVGHIDA